MKKIDGIPVWGEPLQNAVDQMKTCMEHDRAIAGALMADHHLGYAMPIGGVIAYEDAVSPSGVGFDIACGNKAVLLDGAGSDLKRELEEEGAMSLLMDDIVGKVSFGVGQKNKTIVDHALFDDPEWEDIPILAEHKQMAREQLGTVGSGNHYIDVFHDKYDRVWVGCHFGSRGLGHKVATHYIKAGGGKDGINVAPAVLTGDLADEYLRAMDLAGRYAYAGRDWVCQTVADIIGAPIIEEIHNHHNFAWLEEHKSISDYPLWVVRKGATPAWPGQQGFVGGTMGEQSVILEGRDGDEADLALHSTVHGAGRVMSRTQAAGRTRWKKGQKVRISEGEVSQEMMNGWVRKADVELRGGGLDESPDCYKRLKHVLRAQGETIGIRTELTPMGVAMAGANEFDPYKD